MKEIEEKLVSIICDYVDVQPQNVDMNMNLKFDIGLDSFGMISLVSAIESEFDISIPESKFAVFDTLNDMVNYISTETCVTA